MQTWVLALVVVSLCGMSYFLGGLRPRMNARARLLESVYEEVSERIKYRFLKDFLHGTWKCVHYYRDACRMAEIVSGANRVTLPNLNIPNGSIVSFAELLSKADWHPDTPYLGGLERLLKMTVYVTREYSDEPPDD